LVIISQFLWSTLSSQDLQPGFDGKEYTDMLAINFQRFDSMMVNPAIPVSSDYHTVYRSPELGLKNRWNMWYRNDNKLAVISLRGTVAELPSWLENYYAAMVPATGSLQLNDSTVFNYQLAADEKAHVHVGWLTGLAHLAPSITEQIKLAYQRGIHEFIIIGHSQGGALATLTRSYLFYLSQKGTLPTDIRFKTYCSAAPKTGNLYYAYDFDFITRNGWAFTVVNAADWVPETLFSVQTLTDFNPVNPFTNVAGVIKKHERTRPDKVEDRTNHMLAVRAQTGLILIAYRRSEKIEKLINDDRGAFIALAHGLQDASLPALNAIDARNADGLLAAGAAIDRACESCHLKYWYPDTAQATAAQQSGAASPRKP